MEQRKKIQVGLFVFSPCSACGEPVLLTSSRCYYCDAEISENRDLVEVEPTAEEIELLSGPAASFLFLPTEGEFGELAPLDLEPKALAPEKGLSVWWKKTFHPDSVKTHSKKAAAALEAQKSKAAFLKIFLLVSLSGSCLYFYYTQFKEPELCEMTPESQAFVQAMDSGDTAKLSKMTEGKKTAMIACKKK